MWVYKVAENPSAWGNQEYGGILCLRGEDCSLQLRFRQHCLVCQKQHKGFHQHPVPHCRIWLTWPFRSFVMKSPLFDDFKVWGTSQGKNTVILWMISIICWTILRLNDSRGATGTQWLFSASSHNIILLGFPLQHATVMYKLWQVKGWACAQESPWPCTLTLN